MTNSMDMNLSKLQEILKDRDAWHATVHGVAKSRAQIKNRITKTLDFDSGLVYFFFPVLSNSCLFEILLNVNPLGIMSSWLIDTFLIIKCHLSVWIHHTVFDNRNSHYQFCCSYSLHDRTSILLFSTCLCPYV